MKIKILSNFDNWLISDFFKFYNMSKTFAYKAEIMGAIKLNEKIVKRDFKLKKGDILEFPDGIDEDDSIKASNEEIKIVYEDDDVLIVNKRPFILIHSDGSNSNTLCNSVKRYYVNKNISFPPRPSHRLDYETSGMVVFSKNYLTLTYFEKIFSQKEVKKVYKCWVEGTFSQKEGTISSAIAKNRHENKQIALKSGPLVKTSYKVIKTKGNYSYLEVMIEGGKKHQIRVHLASINHPIVGDKIYGKEKKRLLLHFEYIEFIHPRTLEKFKCFCECPFINEEIR